jgi:hypothetical protein
VGVLALAQPTEAKIVYTPTNLQCPCNIDLNNDGTNDFAIGNSSGAVRFDATFGTYTARGLNKGNRIWGVRHHPLNSNTRWVQRASALSSGVLIHADRKLEKDHNVMFSWSIECTSQYCSYTGFGGYWMGAQNRYLGLRFIINDKVHYGWARLSVQYQKIQKGFLTNVTLSGYAYETITNKGIIAGKTKGKDVVMVQPGSLGNLARGSAGLPAWYPGK